VAATFSQIQGPAAARAMAPLHPARPATDPTQVWQMLLLEEIAAACLFAHTSGTCRQVCHRDFSALSRNFSCFSRLAAVLCSARSATAGQCNVISWQYRVVLHPELPCSSAELIRRSETVILRGDAANIQSVPHALRQSLAII